MSDVIIFLISICSSVAAFSGIIGGFPTPSNAFILIGQCALAFVNSVAAFCLVYIVSWIVYGLFEDIIKRLFKTKKETSYDK